MPSGGCYSPEVTRQADRVVFAGRSGGVVHLVQKKMEFEGYIRTGAETTSGN